MAAQTLARMGREPRGAGCARGQAERVARGIIRP
jgi:hypothetical protein